MDNDGSHDILLVQALVGRGPSEFGVAAAGMTHFCVAIDSHSYLPILFLYFNHLYSLLASSSSSAIRHIQPIPTQPTSPPPNIAHNV
jgi:hypothetical protein